MQRKVTKTAPTIHQIDLTYPIPIMTGNWKEDIDLIKTNPQIKTNRHQLEILVNAMRTTNGTEDDEIVNRFDECNNGRISFTFPVLYDDRNFDFQRLVATRKIPHQQSSCRWNCQQVTGLGKNGLPNPIPFVKPVVLLRKLSCEDAGCHCRTFNSPTGCNGKCGIALKVTITIHDENRLPKVNLAFDDELHEKSGLNCNVHPINFTILDYLSVALISNNGQHVFDLTFSPPNFHFKRGYENVKGLQLYWPRLDSHFHLQMLSRLTNMTPSNLQFSRYSRTQ